MNLSSTKDPRPLSDIGRPMSELTRSRHLSTPREVARPTSDIGAAHKNPEAEAIDRWFEDLSYYEQTLEQMAKTKLDDNFREELLAIEKWYTVLSESERTTAMYSLLQHTNAVQIRFFTQVLTQMSAKLESKSPQRPSSSLSSSPNSGVLNPPRVEVTLTQQSGLLPHSPNPAMYDPFAAPNSPLLRPQTPGETAISSADWSMNPPTINHTSVRSKSPSYERSKSPSFEVAPPTRGSSMASEFHPAKGWEHTSLRPPGSPYANSDYSDLSDDGRAGSSSHKEKGKIPDTIDFALLEGIYLPFMP